MAVWTLALTVLAWTAWTGSATAATKTWNSTATLWSDPTGWTPAGVPTAADDVVIDSASVTVSAADAAAGSLALTNFAGLTINGDHTLTVGATKASTIAGSVLLSHGNLKLNGTTTWSAGQVNVVDAGVLTNAGTLHATGTVAFFGTGGGFAVASGGVTDVSGTLSVGTDIDNDGTLRALAGGTLSQSGEVATPSASTGAFDAQGTGVLAFSNVLMAAGASAGGTGTIEFAGGHSRVAPGVAYAAGTTTIGSSGDLDFDDDGTTSAMTTSFGTRRGDGTLTVGAGQSSLDRTDFHDAGVTAFSAGSQTEITGTLDVFDGHRLHLAGATTWSGGGIELIDTAVVENAGTLDVTGNVSASAQDRGGTQGRKAFDVEPGGVTRVSGSLSVAAEIDNDGTLQALVGGSLGQSGEVVAPADSSGVFDAQGTGVLSFSNVLMGAASSTTGSGTIAFGGGHSRVAAGAGYAAGVTELNNFGDLQFDDDGTTGALITDFGTRSGTGTLTVGNGQSELGRGDFHDAGVTAFSAGSQTEITGTVDVFDGHRLHLAGATTWSAGGIELIDTAVVENAGTLDVTGNVSASAQDRGGTQGRKAFDVEPGGVTRVSGSLSVAAEIDNDGTLQALVGGFLSQSGEVITPADSSGVFDAQGTGVLAFSNVLMGAASSATGTGTIAFGGGHSRVAPGAGYAAGVTELDSFGDLQFDDDGSTGALITNFGVRRGTGTLTVGNGQSELGRGDFHDAGVTAFSAGSQTEITGTVDVFDGHRLRLAGATTWSAGGIELIDTAVVENAGTLDVPGNVSASAQDRGGTQGRKAFDVEPGGVTQVSGSLSVAAEIDNDGTLRAQPGGTLSQSGEVVTPAESTGTFDAQGTGVLALSNVLMGAASSATGTGTIAFGGGHSRVAAGAGYAAGVTELDSFGDLQFDDDGSTGALITNFGVRRGTGTLTVGNGQSELGRGTFAGTGTTTFSPGSHTLIDGFIDLATPLRLDGVTTWSTGSISAHDGGAVEKRGALTVTGDVAINTGLTNAAGTTTVQASGSISGDVALDAGTLAGAGTVFGNVTNTGGTVSPGNTLAVTGDYSQGPAGTLRIDIAGTSQFDVLSVGATATLDGTLRLVNATGFDPATADTFRIVDAFARAGTFTTLAGAQANAQKRYVPTYDDTGVLLGVGNGPGNDVRPSIPPSADVGDTVSCAPGTWTGAPSFAYAWLRNGAQVATGQSYRLAGADGGQAVVCRVTATNANGSGTADSNTLRPTAPPPPPTPTPTPPPPTPTPTPSPTPVATATPPPPPQTGETVNVAAERGTVTVKLPDGRTVPIDQATQIVTGSVIDTRQGAVRLDSRGAHGKLATGVFYDGLFRITQSTGKRPVTELKLVEKLSCPKAKGAQTARKRKRKRRHLWGDAKGDYRTRGQYGSAVNTGTKWMIEDRCDGTLFRVARGVIKVTPNGSRKSVRVRAGHRYLVRRPR